jgi:sigma-B regulation protein RsbU (phosphoserine phosphatase)
MMTLNLSIWILAAFFFAYLFKDLGEPRPVVLRVFFVSLNTGLITAVMAFFLLEHISQGHMARYIFPDGGLYDTPKTIRSQIAVKQLALLFACNIIPFLSFIQLYYLSTPNHQDIGVILPQIRITLLTNSIFFILVGFGLTLFVHTNFAVPLREIIRTLKDIRKGIFGSKVIIRSNDEIGYAGDVINEMSAGLKEREQLRQSLFVAKEVQQNLLPSENPEIDGLDIAGRSIYCDETGGDYYDFLNIGNGKEGAICVVVGDVSDHGISSALLMTTARAFLKQRISRSGELNQIASDVNRQLSRDVEDSGRFMTLFLCEIVVADKCLQWIRAGHDPAMLYDPIKNTFVELAGEGLPLGVFENTRYQSMTREIQPGQIVIIGTDGIWETTSPDGRLFGKDRFKETIRTHHQDGAEQIVSSVFDDLDSFACNGNKPDDVTLVIVKVEK